MDTLKVKKQKLEEIAKSDERRRVESERRWQRDGLGSAERNILDAGRDKK